MITRCYPFSHDAVTSDVEHIVRERRVARRVLEKIHASFRLVGFQKFWLALFSDVFPRRSPTVVDGRSALVLLYLVLHCARASMLPGFLFNLFIISILTIDVDRLKFYADRLPLYVSVSLCLKKTGRMHSEHWSRQFTSEMITSSDKWWYYIVKIPTCECGTKWNQFRLFGQLLMILHWW